MDQKKLEQVIEEYILRMVKNRKAGIGTTTDYLIDCPECGNMRSMQFKGGEWQCLWRDCPCILPSEIAPPSPQQFKEIMALKRDLDFLNKWGHLLE